MSFSSVSGDNSGTSVLGLNSKDRHTDIVEVLYTHISVFTSVGFIWMLVYLMGDFRFSADRKALCL